MADNDTHSDSTLNVLAGTAPRPFDETMAANPEEIELDELDDDGDAEAVEAAEAAKRDSGQDNSMFHSQDLHNYDPASVDNLAVTDAAAGNVVDTACENGISPALALAMPKAASKTE